MSNYSILEQNVLDSFETDEAGAAFLWACSLPDADRYRYRAEEFAREVDRLGQSVWQMLAIAEQTVIPMLPAAASQGWTEDVKENLFRFLMDRHTFGRHPGRKTGWTGPLQFSPKGAPHDP